MKPSLLLRPLAGLAVLVLAGCRTLPDLQPFAASTAQIASSVRGAGKSADADAQALLEAYRDDAREVRKQEGPEQAADLEANVKKLEATAEKLKQAWAANVKMMAAVEGYSTSLAQIWSSR